MDSARVHFEVYIRRAPGASWTLELATENRALACTTAEDCVNGGHAIGAKVTKETLDEETREFHTVRILNVGDVESGGKKKRPPPEALQPLCVTPQDLYTLHARGRIAELLEGWLERKRAVPFELLHSPALVEELEASGNELQHAVQKLAVPEAQARGMTVHELMRTFHGLVKRTIDRLMLDHKRGLLPDFSQERFAVACDRLAKHPDRGYLVGAGVAGAMGLAQGWTEKLERLLDLIDTAPRPGPARDLAVSVLEQPVAEILGSKAGLEGILGKCPDLGAELAALTRLAASEAVDMLIRMEPSVAKVMPVLSPGAQRLANWLASADFAEVRVALGKRILRELNGPRRLRPGDAVGEIDVLRGLAMALTAASGKLLPHEDVQAAFSERSKMLITGDFVDAYLGQGKSAREEVEALVWLCENVIGPANKRHAARWLNATVMALRFEKEMLTGTESASVRLSALASLHRSAGRCGLAPEDSGPIQARLGDMGGVIEAEARLTATLARAKAPVVQRLTLLLKLASGESAPLGPAADRARAEAMKLVRDEATRAELAQAPDQMTAVRDLIQSAGMAA